MTNPTQTRHLKFIAFNARGILPQKYEFRRLLLKYKIDIALLNETHLKPYNNFHIANYSVYRNDRTWADGGGTAIIIKKGIPHQQLHLPPLQTIEATGALIKIKHQELLIAAVYKQPDKPLPNQDPTELTNLSLINI